MLMSSFVMLSGTIDQQLRSSEFHPRSRGTGIDAMGR